MSGIKSLGESYVGDFETPEKDFLGGYQDGNGGILSKNASNETVLHEVLFTLGFYTPENELHKYPDNPKSILFAGSDEITGSAAQDKYKQTITLDDMTNLTNSGKGNGSSNVKSAYFKPKKQSYGTISNKIYDSKSANSIVNEKNIE